MNPKNWGLKLALKGLRAWACSLGRNEALLKTMKSCCPATIGGLTFIQYPRDAMPSVTVWNAGSRLSPGCSDS